MSTLKLLIAYQKLPNKLNNSSRADKDKSVISLEMELPRAIFRSFFAVEIDVFMIDLK